MRIQLVLVIHDPVSNSDDRYRGAATTAAVVLFLDEGRDYFHTLLIFATLAHDRDYN